MNEKRYLTICCDQLLVTFCVIDIRKAMSLRKQAFEFREYYFLRKSITIPIFNHYISNKVKVFAAKYALQAFHIHTKEMPKYGMVQLT